MTERNGLYPSEQLEEELRWTPDVLLDQPCPACGERNGHGTVTAYRCNACGEYSRLPEPNPYAVGSIWRTSWGYDQTNVEFYTVVRETKASVWLVPMGSEIRDGREHPTDPVLWSMGPTDVPGVYPARMHRKPRAAWAIDAPYLHLDDVRHAWPYTGGGAYSTDASGGVGH